MASCNHNLPNIRTMLYAFVTLLWKLSVFSMELNSMSCQIVLRLASLEMWQLSIFWNHEKLFFSTWIIQKEMNSVTSGTHGETPTKPHTDDSCCCVATLTCDTLYIQIYISKLWCSCSPFHCQHFCFTDHNANVCYVHCCSTFHQPRLLHESTCGHRFQVSPLC